MAKITRATQKLFASSATSGQIAKFGSAAASGFSGGTTYSGATATPANIQLLAAWVDGWFDAVDGQYNPAIEDVNAVDWLYSYQLCYLFQSGIPEWDAGTTYYIGSFVSNGTGGIYYSLTNTNLNNAVSDVSKWAKINSPPSALSSTSSGIFSDNSNDYVDVTNMEVTITPGVGGKVEIRVVPDGTINPAEVGLTWASATGIQSVYFRIERNTNSGGWVEVARTVLNAFAGTSSNTSGFQTPPGLLYFEDTGFTAGASTQYKLQLLCGPPSTGFVVYCKLSVNQVL